MQLARPTTIMQSAALALFVAIPGLLLVRHAFLSDREVLHIFWKLIVPMLPLLILIAPELWRNICPISTLNLFGYKLSLLIGLQKQTLPARPSSSTLLKIHKFTQMHGLLVAMGLFYIIIPMRLLLFNHSAAGLLYLLLAIAGFAIAGGLLLPFKSGWCASICPMYPLEKSHGVAPLYVVSNTRCQSTAPGIPLKLSCSGCSRNCLDLKLMSKQSNIPFVPLQVLASDKEANEVFAKIHSVKSPDYIGLFLSLLPGAIAAYSLFDNVVPLSSFTGWQRWLVVYATFAILMTVSSGVYQLLCRNLISMGQISKRRAKLLFVALSLNTFYFVMLPQTIDFAAHLFRIASLATPYADFAGIVAVVCTSIVWLHRAW